ncbi:MAG: nicotinate-nucleotide diphosphorylase, partial [Gemmatimonadota bacterium]
MARRALEEDLGAGDLTTELLVARDARGTATLVARAAGVVCGLDLVRAVFRDLDPTLAVEHSVSD